MTRPPGQGPSAFWTVVTVMLALVLLDTIHDGLGVLVGVVVAVVLIARAFARMARRELGGRRPR
jgi:MFS superfamily sulfate permease-like transporter